MMDDDEDGRLPPPPMDGSSSDDDDTLAQLELEREANAKLKEKLRLVQKRRNEARQRRAASLITADAVNDRKYQIEMARATQQDLWDAIQTTDRRIATARTQLQRARGWHVLAGDAYHVDQEIMFFRPSSSSSSNSGAIMTTTTTISSPPRPPPAGGNSTTTTTTTTMMVMIGTMNGLRLAAPTYTATGSWKEVNSALGYVALLLSQLERQLLLLMTTTTTIRLPPPGENTTITTGHHTKNGGTNNHHRTNNNNGSNSNSSQCNNNTLTTTARPATLLLPPLRYAVLAAGGSSKIGPRGSGNYNNLFFAEDSFTFFSKRNFNTALGYLLGHVSDLTRAILMTLPMVQPPPPPPPPPYEINETARTIGGVPLIWIDDATSATDFTRAARYLLTNLQHLLGCQEAVLAAWGTGSSGGGVSSMPGG